MAYDAQVKTDAEKAACKFAWEIQDACNLRALVSHWLGHLDAMRADGITGDLLNNHPSTLAFVSKLTSLARMDNTREMKALGICHGILLGEQTLEPYEVIEL